MKARINILKQYHRYSMYAKCNNTKLHIGRYFPNPLKTAHAIYIIRIRKVITFCVNQRKNITVITDANDGRERGRQSIQEEIKCI